MITSVFLLVSALGSGMVLGWLIRGLKETPVPVQMGADKALVERINALEASMKGAGIPLLQRRED